jgi:hypothetical protein
MGVFNNVSGKRRNHFTLSEALLVGGVGIGGGVGAYREDSSFIRGSAAGVLGTFGIASMAVGVENPGQDKMGIKSRLAHGAVGAGMVALGVGIFNKRKEES